MSEPPFLLVVAGPNGSGKSTLINYLMSAGLDFGEYINPDQIAAELAMPEPARSRRAQQIADHRRERCLNNRLNFSFETVMSHPSKVDLMIRAVDAGYDVTVFFVCTSDPAINVRRVENRVGLGGHYVPRERIVARYWRTLNLLSHATLVARRTILFDNSALVGYRANSQLPNPQIGLRPVGEIVGNGTDYQVRIGFDAPAWVDQFLVRPLYELARSKDSGIAVTVEQKKSPLG